MDDDENNDEDNGWKILKQGVVLFETTMGSLDKLSPHPVLDNPSKMMRIIANPLYDKLTLSRAAHIRKFNPSEYIQLNRPKGRTVMTPLKSLDIEQTITTPLPNPSELSNSRPQSKYASKRQTSPPFHLPVAATTSRISSRKTILSARSRPPTQSSSITDNNTSNIKIPIADGTIRYVNSRHGFEVQRYSSNNWLTIDVFCKDACQAQEKAFREMLDKKRQYERLSRSIYSSDYYSKRWHELLQSYKKDYLTHAEWAKQNYQLLCLKTLYSQASKREQRDVDLDKKDVRRVRAQSAFNQWKETKTEGNIEPNQRTTTTERTSFLSNNSFSNVISNSTDENKTTTGVDTTNRRMSISTSGDSESQQILVNQPIILPQNPSGISSSLATSKGLYMLDEQRWSLQAMLKRVVGLAEPLSPSPKVIQRKQSRMTNTSTDSGFESVS